MNSERVGERQIHRLFELTLILKALHSLLEIVGGLVLAGMGRGTVLKFASLVTRGELIEDPNDLIANYILHAAQNFSVSAKAAAVVFLLSHGIVKLVLVLSVMRGFPWAYPAFMVALGFLIIIQSYQLWRQVSFVLLAMTVFDLLVLVLTWHEYRFIKSNRRLSRRGLE